MDKTRFCGGFTVEAKKLQIEAPKRPKWEAPERFIKNSKIAVSSGKKALEGFDGTFVLPGFTQI